MVSARFVYKSFLVTTLFTAALALNRTTQAQAAVGVVTCQPSTSCTIGEFLYDDDYSPLPNQTCTLTSRNPNDSLLHDGVVLSSESDGWYSHEFSAPSENGWYRAQVCCSVDGDQLCIDKSFQVQSVWGEKVSDHTKTGTFGESLSPSSIFQTIWGAPGKALNGVSSSGSGFISNTTNAISKLFSSDGSTLGDLAQVKKLTEENRLLLEKLVNEPIIEIFLEQDDAPDLTKKLEETESVSAKLMARAGLVDGRVGWLSLGYNSMTEREVLDGLSEISKALGGNQDAIANGTLYGYVNWFSANWDFAVVPSMSELVRGLRVSVVDLQSEVAIRGKSSRAQAMLADLTLSNNRFFELLGDDNDSSETLSLFGNLAKARFLAKTLDQKTNHAQSLLGKLSETSVGGVQAEVVLLAGAVGQINRVNGAAEHLVVEEEVELESKQVRNNLLAIMGVVDANRQLLARAPGKAFSSVWLEEGSVVVKALITNPSALISQDVPLKFFFPKEIREEDVLELDEGVRIGYDTVQDMYYAQGSFSLAPTESTTVRVKLRDVFKIAQGEIDAIRVQVAQLVEPLRKTSYYAQAVSLSSDIEVGLQRVEVLQGAAITPEQKIRANREARIEMEGVYSKMDAIKDLLAQTGAASSLRGFIGGAQAVGVWGVIVAVISGVVFLSLYMRMLAVKEAKRTRFGTRAEVTKKSKAVQVKAEVVGKEPKKTWSLSSDKSASRRLKLSVPVVSVLVAVGVVGSMVVTRGLVEKGKDARESKVLGEESKNTEAYGSGESGDVEQNLGSSDQLVASGDGLSEPSGQGGVVTVVVPDGSYVNVRNQPNSGGEVVARLEKTTKATRLREREGWVEVGFASTIGVQGAEKGWVFGEFVSQLNQASVGGRGVTGSSRQKVLVDVPSGSSIAVRESASLDSAVVLRLEGNTQAEKLGETSNWVQLLFTGLDNGGDVPLGWVNKDFLASADDLADTGKVGGTDSLIGLSSRVIPISGKVAVSETSTGWLRVRSGPSLAYGEVAKVYPKDEFDLVARSFDGWYKIDFGSGEGWVSGLHVRVLD